MILSRDMEEVIVATTRLDPMKATGISQEHLIPARGSSRSFVWCPLDKFLMQLPFFGPSAAAVYQTVIAYFPSLIGNCCPSLKRRVSAGGGLLS
jgi:hypothetical protein